MTIPQTNPQVPRDPKIDESAGGFDRGFLAIVLHINRVRSLMLLSLRDQYHGDLEEAQIACVLMTATVGGNLLYANEALQRLGKDGLPDPILGPWRKLPLRVSELVGATGLPRETVRRKLLKLESNSLAERDSSGRWLWVMAQVGKTREEYREVSSRLLHAASQLRELLKAAEQLLHR